MGLLEKLKEHWFGGVILFGCAVAGTTWLIANEILVKPRDFTIEQQKTTIADMREKIKDLQEEKGKGASESSLTSATPAKTPRLSLARPGPPSATVLVPTWISEGQPFLMFDDQVMIKVSSASGFIHSATIDIELPSEKIHWGVLGVGETKTFVYRGQTYFFRIIEVMDRQAKVTIAKKL
jgi:hypothetical protein